MKKIYALLLALFFCTANGLTQTPVLIKNVNPVTTDAASGSFPKKGIALNGNFYFPATNNNGSELWTTDGTAAGTSMLKDIASLFDRQDANPRLFITRGDSLYFFARGGFHFYKYVPLTGKITEVPVGRDNTYSPTEAVAIGDNIFFAGEYYYGQGVELLRFNIVDQSLSIYDLSPDTFSSYPHNLTAVGDSLFFAATDTTNGTELWMYDVNTDAYSLVQDIAPGLDSSNPVDLVAYNNKLFFTAMDTTFNGNEIWVSDGSGTGTYQYADINTDSAGSSNPAHKTVFDNKLFFSADDGTNGNELWMVDDVSFTTAFLVSDINSSGDSNPGKYGFKVMFDTLLYFAADDGNSGEELWKMDLNLVPYQAADINSSGDSYPMDMYSLGDTLIFVANDGSNGWQIWRSNGTAATTAIIQSIQPGSADTIHIAGVLNDRVYFGADDGTHGVELWKTGGMSATTSMVKDLNFGAAISSDPQWFEPFSSAMFFNARTNADYYFGLFKTDATSSGTVEIKHGSIADNFSVGPFQPAVLGSDLVFAGFTDSTGFELWKSDGTAAGTVRIKSIYPGQPGSIWSAFTILGSNAYFIADDSAHGPELWKTDGTAAGTSLVKDIRSGLTGSEINEFRVANSKLFFTANDSVHGRELWVSDGTTSGTVMLNDIMSGTASSSPGNLYAAGSLLYFTADDGTNGGEVWTSDGTASGTTMLKDINIGSDPSQAGFFARMGAWVYFSATDTTNVSTKLWRTDGTAANTSRFYDVNFPFLLYNVGTRIVFISQPAGSTNGFHMWSTDGTVAGTTEIEDFMPGEVGYFILDNFTVYNGHVFYWIDDNISGQELWGSDGTAAGTVKYDIAAGVASSYPRSARGLNPLIFSADDGSINGREPWMLNVSTPLPITGLEFSAEKRDATAFLQWKTLSEKDVLGFEVQRSANGISFDAIGFVDAMSGAATGSGYHFTDAQPLNGRNYYRLKQTAKNGKSEFSNIRSVTFNNPEQVTAYPNPAAEVLNISTGHTFVDGQLSVSNLSGQLILKQSVSGAGIIRIPVKDLPTGIYRAEISEGSYAIRLLFVKQ